MLLLGRSGGGMRFGGRCSRVGSINLKLDGHLRASMPLPNASVYTESCGECCVRIPPQFNGAVFMASKQASLQPYFAFRAAILRSISKISSLNCFSSSCD